MDNLVCRCALIDSYLADQPIRTGDTLLTASEYPQPQRQFPEQLREVVDQPA
jgi:hypothetical protein